jgi:hypothetical protein
LEEEVAEEEEVAVAVDVEAAAAVEATQAPNHASNSVVTLPLEIAQEVINVALPTWLKCML